MTDDEVRVTAPSGGEKGKKLARYDLLPVEPLREVARLYGRGAEKYADRNWELGYDWSLSFAAMQRHAWAFWGGESIDPETERHHLASVVFHAMALMEYEAKGKGRDDRSSAVTAVTPLVGPSLRRPLPCCEFAAKSGEKVARQHAADHEA